MVSWHLEGACRGRSLAALLATVVEQLQVLQAVLDLPGCPGTGLQETHRAELEGDAALELPAVKRETLARRPRPARRGIR